MDDDSEKPTLLDLRLAEGPKAETGGDGALETAPVISAAEFRRRAETRLSLELPPATFDPAVHPAWGDHSFTPGAELKDVAAIARPAAVLVPIVARAEGPTILLTKRAARLRQHSGQIAFPGGKIDAEDTSPLHAALREAEEEIGLSRDTVTPLGYLDVYLTGTGYRIVPVVAWVSPPLTLVCNPDEVEDAFEVPLDFLMDPSNHRQETREWRGRHRNVYAMPFGDRNIWGATAGILRNLYERLVV